jgi:signal transduction histidine kinase/DNA-binding response OmpR family regulator
MRARRWMRSFLEDKVSSQERYHPIGKSLLISSLTVAVLSLAIAFASMQALVYGPARRAVAQAELATTARQVELSLSALFKRADTVARLRRDWGALGIISTADEAGIVRHLGTELTHEPDFSSVAIADETGREVLLRTSPEHLFLTRQTDPDIHPGTEIDTTWTQDGRRLERVIRDSDYDARRRPWFLQVRDTAADADVTWTAPYVFRSTGLPGMSAVVQWKSPDGHRTISKTDITLMDISRFTRGIEVGRHGFAIVVTGDGAIVGLPGGEALTGDAAARSLLLQPLSTLHQPALDSAFARWRAQSPLTDRILRFASGDQSWLASFSRIALDGRVSLYVGVVAPESDFAILGTEQWATLAAILLATVSLTAWTALRAAQRFARPLKELAAASERFGRLDLAQPVRVASRWSEVAETARAQEVMRQGLLHATEGLEAAVERRTRQLTVAVAAADEAARAKAAFLANMSHEIRTPLNAILGLTTLLLKTTISETQRDYLGRLGDSARLLLHIVNDVLDFSKIEAGKLSFEEAEFSLDDLLQRVANILVLEIVMRRASDVPDLLVGDQTRLEQVLINIAGNAVKFTASGEVVIEAALEASQPECVQVHFTIRDTGIGMSAQQLQQLFQPFKQGDDSITRRFGGTGLGLAISKYLVELMGGAVSVDSTLMVGSTFHVSVPLRTIVLANDGGNAKPWHPLSGLHALVVDDNATSLSALCEMLASFDVSCHAMADGNAAVEEFVRAQTSTVGYPLVLVDWSLPGINGLDVIERIRELASSPSSDFIMISARDLVDAERRITDARLAGLIAKPATPSSLLEALLTGIGKPGLTPVAASLPAAPNACRASSGQQVLLIEDNEVNLLIASEFLKSAGLLVTTASSAQEAIDLVSSGARFDLLFMDVQMAHMDGLEATRVLRTMPCGADLVIVALTAHALQGDRARCLAAGMDDYLSKPLSPEALNKCLRRWLNLGLGT